MTDPIPADVMEAAQRAAYPLGTLAETDPVLVIARALLAERIRATEAERENAAQIADAYAQELEDSAPNEETPDMSERTLVYAKHVRRAARMIRKGDHQ